MKLYKETPFAITCRNAVLEPQRTFMTIVVKGTYEIGEDGTLKALPANAQPKPAPSVGYLDKLGNARMTDSDLLPFKPRADCIFIGNAYAPGGEPVDALTATFGVGAMRKSLSIIGDRVWRRDDDGSAHLSEPARFTEMPLRDEFAHGGLESKYNLHGKGYETLPEVPGSEVAVANIMPTDHAAMAWDHDALHEGFGVLPPTQLPRRALYGTHDKRWAVHRRPLPPEDFDTDYLNGVREDQRIEGHLAGNEEVFLENLHPTKPEFGFRLPGITSRCFVNRSMDPHHPDDHEFAEVVVLLDTCIVNMLAGQVTLLWRGTLETISKKHERIHHLLVVNEAVGDRKSLEHYAGVLKEKRVDKRAVRAAEEKKKREAEAATIEKDGIAETVALLKDAEADPKLIAEVEKQTTIDGVEQVLADWIKAFQKTLPNSGA